MAAPQPTLATTFGHHELERTQARPKTLHEQMMLEAEPLMQHNWTDVAIHDKAKLRSIPTGHYCYWVVTQMGSYLTPAYCRLSDRSKWTRSFEASLAPIQLLVVRWHADVKKFEGSTHWRRMHDPCRDKHCYLVIKTDASNGHVTPITYEELADLAVCKTRTTVIHRIVDEDDEYL